MTPGKGGQKCFGVPVFNTPQEAVKQLGEIDISVLFVPAAGVKEAAIEAIDAGDETAVLVPDRVPVWDAMEIAAAAKANDASFVGPNTLGVLSPGKAVVGMIGGRAEIARQWFKPGIPTGVGVISRSGGMASSTGYYLGQAGVRISTIVHIGGDAVLGVRIPDVALIFEDDPQTDAIVIFGEIGSSQEEELSRADSRSKSHQASDRIHRRQSGARRNAIQSRRRDHRRQQGHARRQSGGTARGRRDRRRCLRRTARRRG